MSPTGRCRLRDASAGDLARSVPLADQGVRSRLLPCQTQSAVTWRGARSTVQPGAKPACRKPARTSAEDSDLRPAADQARQQCRRAGQLALARLREALLSRSFASFTCSLTPFTQETQNLKWQRQGVVSDCIGDMLQITCPRRNKYPSSLRRRHHKAAEDNGG